MNLTQADIYKALAANPFGKGPNTAQTWKDVNPSLPAIKIRVLGPPPTSGTRDSLADLYLDQGLRYRSGDEGAREEQRGPAQGRSAPRSARTVPMSRPARTTICSSRRCRATRARSASSAIPTSSENADKVRPVQIAGIAPTEETIADLTYPGARKLYIYVKGEHLPAKPKLRDFVAQYAKMWSKGGPLERSGPGAVRRRRCDRGDAAIDRAEAARSERPEVSRSGEAQMSLGLALARHPDRRARGGLARVRPCPPAARRDAGSTRCRSITAPMRRCGRRSRHCCCSPPGRRCKRGWSTRRCSPAPRARRFRRSTMQRESILSEAHEIADGEREQGFNPQSSTLAPRIRAEEAALRDCLGGAAAIIVGARRGRDLALRRSAPQFRARTGVERWVMIVAVRRIADRDPDDARHPPVADVREPALLPAVSGRCPSCSASNGARRRRSAPTRPVRRAPSARSRCSGAPSSSARSSR